MYVVRTVESGNSKLGFDRTFFFTKQRFLPFRDYRLHTYFIQIMLKSTIFYILGDFTVLLSCMQDTH